jgi:predicted AAA+ superfamily ATPase
LCPVGKSLRRLADTVSPHVFLTGSSVRFLNRELAGALRGRALAYTLFPLSFCEYLRFQGNARSDFNSTTGRNRLQTTFARFLCDGGYPEILGMDEPTRLRPLQSYFEIMLYRDYALADHFTDALFVVPVEKYNTSAAKQSQALKKYYGNDTGLLNACWFTTAENRGALLETFVFLELQKHDENPAYYSETRECDFLTLERGTITGAI